MKGIILTIHDFLSCHKGLTAIILGVVAGLCALSASRLTFNEDITDFLPRNEQVKGQEKMAVLFEGGTLDEKLDAMYAFDLAWDMPAADTDMFSVNPDPRRIDSLLSVPGYIDRVLEEDKALLMSPNPVLSNYVRQDPLRLNASLPDVRIEDGYLFTRDGETGIIFFDSPYGGSESSRNAALIDSLNAVKAAIGEAHPSVHIYSTGGPEVAAGNSSRIKKDSFLALAIAALLILAVLWFSYKRFQDVLWILISIAFGALFALGAIAIVKPSISIIILGIGCTVIGIAVNYPLHFVDHLKYEPDRREALAQQVEPLLTGNITTVGAFLGLLLMKAPALRDFGFVGAMMLLGTIVFVLFFLPVFIPEAKGPRNTLKLDLDRNFNPSKKTRRVLFCAFVAVTVFFASEARKVGFDTNLHNINYMTPEQEKGFAVLEGLREMPGQAGQDGWALLDEKYPALPDTLIAAGLRHGFTAHAFQPFFDSLDRASAAKPQGSLVEALNEDFKTIGLVCSIIVFLFLILSFRSFSLAVVAFLPLGVSWIWIEGIMWISGLSFNIVNIILATFIFGMGDDYTIFITEGLVYEYRTGKKILHSFKNAVVLSALIMFIGIGVLAFAKHPAMRSLGLVTVIGMVTVVVMACYIPPVLFRWATTKKGQPRRSPVTIGSVLKTIWICFLYGLVMGCLIIWAHLYFLIGKDSEKKRLRFHKVIQAISKAAIYTVPGARYTLINPHGEDFSKPAVYVCNHQSHLDVLAIMALSPRLAFTTNDWVWHFPLYRYILRKAEFYPAANGHSGNAGHVKNLVERGYSIVVFPEGTRSLDGEILRFHRGGFLTARELDIDVLPLCIKGFTDVLPKHDFFLRKGRLTLEVGERIQVPEDAEIRTFTRQMRHFYQDWYKK